VRGSLQKVTMTDYSKLSYQELCKIANNDEIAEAMPEEEYETLSREMWKKFRIEKRIVVMDPEFEHTKVELRSFNQTLVNAPLSKHAAAMK
jgi:hypothetical protein